VKNCLQATFAIELQSKLSNLKRAWDFLDLLDFFRLFLFIRAIYFQTSFVCMYLMAWISSGFQGGWPAWLGLEKEVLIFWHTSQNQRSSTLLASN
jgi:hypothetical protein